MTEILRLTEQPAKSFIPMLRKHLKSIGYLDNPVIVRYFDQSRINRVVQSGTDRDEYSYVWNTRQDVDHVQLEKNGIDVGPSDILYAFVWYLEEGDDRRVVCLGINGEESFQFLDYLNTLSNQSIAIYDSSLLQRKSESEYWFSEPNKAKALLAVTIFNFNKDPIASKILAKTSLKMGRS